MPADPIGVPADVPLREMRIMLPRMIRAVRFVTVYVRDHEQAIDFYAGKLGFEKRDDTEWGAGFRWVEVAPPRSQTSLVLVRPSLGLMGPDRASSAEERIGGVTGIIFETDDIEATFHELSERGVHFTNPPTPRSWGGCAAQFIDGDGNAFLLVQP